MDQTSVLLKYEVLLGIFKQMAYGPWRPATGVSTWGKATDRHLYSLQGFFFFFTYFAKSSKSVAKDSAVKYQREYYFVASLPVYYCIPLLNFF